MRNKKWSLSELMCACQGQLGQKVLLSRTFASDNSKAQGFLLSLTQALIK